MPRKIPAVMFSQHPDHTHKPYWHSEALIKTHDEIKECILMFKDVGAEEMMWDWEGKLADESVVERLLTEQAIFFQKKPLGKELFLTFRVPNPRVESGYRLGRALMVILSARELKDTGSISHNPVFEIILPMTETAGEIFKLQKGFKKFAKVVNTSFGKTEHKEEPIEIIPLFERVDTLLKSGNILNQYLEMYKKEFKHSPEYLRPFCARSDPSMNSGIVPTTLAIKWALSEYAKFTKKTKIPTFPIIAPGSLPFRGGLTPDTSLDFVREFAGMKTLVIQSSFRYDHNNSKVKKAVQEIIKEIATTKTEIFPDKMLPEIKKVISFFEKPYRRKVEELVPLIQRVSKYIPKRRERMQHIGLFGYSRQVGKNKLPRAIGFTASCYSIGIPPEFLGTGKGIEECLKNGKIDVVKNLYKNLNENLERAGRFLRKESIKELGLLGLLEEIESLERYTGFKFGPKTKEEIQHSKLSGKILAKIKKNQNPSKEILEAALLRKSLG
ncbi:MAG: phosphoenolpyruvate carboxylase [Candidatus Pacebacteria bacterium]|nr:phosphoenolpyruvate carboxylase [Candidatus Paceibacterota bacterium]MCF7862465.1 phosphoenolpyruvate carboxylase [Candidatus Paceibacterota bacterium]